MIGEKWRKMIRKAAVASLFAALVLSGCSAQQSTMSATQKKAVENSLVYISESDFSFKDRINKKKFEIRSVTSGELQFVWNDDLQMEESALDTSDWVITIGDTSGHDFAVMICDSRTSEVLGYIPIE